MKKCFLFLGLVFLFLGCSQSFDTRGNSEKKTSKSVTRSIDNSTYKDVTLSSVNATLLDKIDFASLCNGTYYNGESYIKFDMEKGRCVMYTPTCAYPEYSGKEFSSDFIYTVKAASSNCLYIMPSTMNKAGYYIDGKYYACVGGLPFALYLPLYGFGENRVEVSSVLNGEICMPSGTYWKKESK